MEETNNQRIARMYEEAGYKYQVLYLNVRKCNDVPVRGDEENRVLLSGFSPSLFNQVLEIRKYESREYLFEYNNE